MKKIGFCCKYIESYDQCNGLGKNDLAKKYNTSTTTITWLNRQDRKVAEEKLYSLVLSNLKSTLSLLNKVSTFNDELKMLRLISDILPVYTHPDYSYFYKNITELLETKFLEIGEFARKNNIRLSFHPGQFCVLASDNDTTVANSIKELEYHADIARMMGYGKQFQDFKINVHLSGKKGVDGFLETYKKLSDVAKNCLTIENDENVSGIDQCLKVSHLVPIVMDIHHHWCKTGEYILNTDDNVKRIKDSWRGVRPVLHYSVSDESLFFDTDKDILLNIDTLRNRGINKQKLRSHSVKYWNTSCNLWAKTFWEDFDIQCESKGKNLSSYGLFMFFLKTS